MATKQIKILTLADLKRRAPKRDPQVFENLFEIRDVVNIVAPSKLGKTYFHFQEAVSCVGGLEWLGFKVGDASGKVLLIDTELKDYHIWSRLYLIADKLGVPRSVVDENIRVVPLRDDPKTISELITELGEIEKGTYRIVTLDAIYKLYGEAMNENQNADIARFYKHLSAWAGRLHSLIQCVHHSTKGDQSDKAVVDVGAGAGSMARAADSHLILRPHQETNCFVLEGVLRNNKGFKPISLRREWPLFIPDTTLDPSKLRSSGAKPRPQFEEVYDLLMDHNMTLSVQDLRYYMNNELGYAQDPSDEALKKWESEGLLYRIPGKNNSYLLSLNSPQETAA